jgi:hypothetical protein
MEAIVSDSFDCKGRVAIEYGATGVIVILNTQDSTDEPALGKGLLIVRPDGWMVRARMGEVKRHGLHGYGIFIQNLTKQDVPIGARLRWGTDFWPSVAEEQAATASLVKV